MDGTTLQDVIVPELFNPYVINRTMELSALFNSGIVAADAAFNALAANPSPLVNMPFWNDLTGESETVAEGTSLAAKKITTNKDVAVLRQQAAMWSATDLSGALAGSDPMAAIGTLVAQFWARDMEKDLIALLNGVFGNYTPSGGSKTTPMGANILDISGGTGAAAAWSASAFIDAQQLLGDAKSQLTAVVMHSATEATLRKLDLITTEKSSTATDGVSTYMGKRVIIDDNCPVTGSGKDKIYSTYLFGSGAIAYGVGNPLGFVQTEIDRDKKMGSGVDYLINRRAFIMHPRGVAYQKAAQAGTFPTRTEIANAQNWNPVWEPKQLRMVEFCHKL